MKKKIGFIGLGKMATAILSGIIDANFVSADCIYGIDLDEVACNLIKDKYCINLVTTNKDLIKNVDIVILCVKPFAMKDLLQEISSFLTSDKVVVSIAAGVSTATIESFLNENIEVIRVMSNTPALLKSGMTAVVKGKNATSETASYILNLCQNIGKAVITDEKYIDVITALSGSGPAFYYYIINQMALSAQKEGLDYPTALLLSAQTALGAAKMILETGKSPEELINAVTTPNGCTEVGNNCLNSSNLADILDNTITKTKIRAYELGK